MELELEQVPILRSDENQDMESLANSDAICFLPNVYPDTKCPFSGQEDSCLDSKERSKSTTRLYGLIIFYLMVMVVEIIGGIKADSLAVLTDAAHLLTDVAGFSIALFTIWVSGWEATPYQSFGFNRLEVLGALLSVQLIWLVSGILIYEAIDRILHKHAEVNGEIMFAIAAFGFIINLIMVIWLGHDHSHHGWGNNDHCHGHHDHDHNHDQHHDHQVHHGHDPHLDHDHDHDHVQKESSLTTEEEDTSLVSSSPSKTKTMNINIQGAYLHVMADLIQSIGVMIGGAIIWAKPDWLIVDLLCTLIFSAFALTATIPMLRNIFYILMERAPSEISIPKLENDLKSIKGVRDIHDLHVWSITVGKIAVSCHVTSEPGVSSREILDKIRYLCDNTYRIHHVTVQIEES